MRIPKLKQLSDASPKNKKIVKPILMVVITILVGALGLEMTNNDFDLGKLLNGESLQEAKIARDSDGNLLFDIDGNPTTDTAAGKQANKYNCEDFENQNKAQNFFNKVGGVGKDVNRLDGDKDGDACENLPQEGGK